MGLHDRERFGLAIPWARLAGPRGRRGFAAEQTGRQAHLMELDPLYCDVIRSVGRNSRGGRRNDMSDGRRALGAPPADVASKIISASCAAPLGRAATSRPQKRRRARRNEQRHPEWKQQCESPLASVRGQKSQATALSFSGVKVPTGRPVVQLIADKAEPVGNADNRSVVAPGESRTDYQAESPQDQNENRYPDGNSLQKASISDAVSHARILTGCSRQWRRPPELIPKQHPGPAGVLEVGL